VRRAVAFQTVNTHVTDTTFDWDPALGEPLGVRLFAGRHLVATASLDEEQARALFNWLGVWLHKQG
jgi:hypothetical protein